MIAFMMAALVQASTYAPLPRNQWPDYVAAAGDAVSKRDAAAIERSYVEIKEVPFEGDHSLTITAKDALGLLSGCTQSDVRQLHEATYVLSYQCAARRKLAKGCDSGDLILMVDNQRSSFAIAHQMNFHPSGGIKCLPSAPPPLPGFEDPREYYNRSKLIIESSLKGDDSVLSDFGMTTGQIFVAPTMAGRKAPVALSGQNLRDLFTGCSRQGQIQVDKSGASTTYSCSNATLKGVYAVDFDFIGKSLYRVWIQTPESRAAMEGAK